MTTHEEIKKSLPEVMKSKDAVKLRTVRSMLTAFTNELVATGKTPQNLLDNEGTIAVIKRLAKQRKDSLEQFEAAGRSELADTEREELAVLQSYLPATMSDAAIKEIASAKKAELGINDTAKIGILVGVVMKETKGQADGSDVKRVIEGLF